MSHADQIAGYTILAVLGYGASSTIYAVQDPRNGQVYALKRVVKEKPEDQRFIDQALTEHHIASQFDHPILRKSHRVLRRRKLLRTSELLVVMELVDGVTLEQHRPPTLREIVEVFRDVADGLSAMHQQGFVHADMKPNNVLITDVDTVKIIDFGQSCPIGTVKQRIQGTPDYIAPEQVRRGPITARTDIFNLGATMYWCLTNHHVPTLIPKHKDEIGLRSEIELKEPMEHNPKVPKALNTLLMDCLKTNPQDRPDSMTEVRARLEIVLHQIERHGEGGGTEAASA